MHSLKKSCLRWTLVYVIIGAALSALVYQRVPHIGTALGCGFGAAILVWMSIGYVAGIRARGAERRLIARATSGERPNDGEKIAVVGTIGSSFDSLEAPISKRRCVAYEYKAIPPRSQEMGVVEGFALVPLTIDGPRGSIRLLACPELEFDFEVFSRLEQYQNFTDYMTDTRFEQLIGIDVKREIARLKTMLADDDGRIRYDIQRMPDIDVSSMQLKEKILATGDKVVAVGRYSAAKNALVPDETAVLYPVKIKKGDPSTARKGGFVELFLGCGCLIPVLIGALLGLALTSLDELEQRFPKKDPSWTEVKIERWLRHDVRPRLDTMIAKGEYSIVLEEGAARGKLTANGTTVRLTHARARRIDDVIEVVFDDAVTARVRSDNTIESLRLKNGETFADAEIETWAADETSVNGRITALSPGDGPKLRVMFRARFE